MRHPQIFAKLDPDQGSSMITGVLPRPRRTSASSRPASAVRKGRRVVGRHVPDLDGHHARRRRRDPSLETVSVRPARDPGTRGEASRCASRPFSSIRPADRPIVRTRSPGRVFDPTHVRRPDVLAADVPQLQNTIRVLRRGVRTVYWHRAGLGLTTPWSRSSDRRRNGV